MLIEDHARQAATLTQIALTYATRGQDDKALEVVQLIDDFPRREAAFVHLAGWYTEIGQYDQALEVAILLKNTTLKTEVLAGVASQYIEDGEYDPAWEVVNTMTDVPLKAGMLAAIASKYAEGGAPKDADETLSQALLIAKASEDPASKAQALVAIGFPYAKTTHRNDATVQQVLHEIIAELGESAWYDQLIGARE
jgi:tetratricopeptide (TPR) repeat protein